MDSVTGDPGYKDDDQIENYPVTPLASPLPPSSSSNISVVLYFGGDLQNTRQTMALHITDGLSRFIENYCYESIGERLHKCYPNHHVLIVRPKAFYKNTFAVYSQYLNIKDKQGTPDFGGTGGGDEPKDAWKQVASILLERFGPKLEQVETTIVGFSKGCTVVNGLIMQSENVSNYDWLVLKEIVLLDSGHNGQDLAWIVQEGTLRNAFASSKIELPRLVTGISDYQREGKPWIGQEYDVFCKEVQKIQEERKDLDWKQFEVKKAGKTASLDDHFRLLDEFFDWKQANNKESS